MSSERAILFVNACPRPQSRTYALDIYGADVEGIMKAAKESIAGLI